MREDEGRKAVYRITDAGRAELRDRAGDVDDLRVDLERSVRQLAEQVRAQVRGGSKELRAELLAAAKTARKSAHDERAAARPPQGRQGQVERAVEELRHGLRAATRREWIDQESVNQIVTIIDRARADVMDVVNRAVDQHRRNP